MKINISYYSLLSQVDSTYGGGAYSSDVYGDATTQTSTEQPTQQTSDGTLANTGFDIVLPVALGVIMIVSSAAAFIKMRRDKKKANV